MTTNNYTCLICSVQFKGSRGKPNKYCSRDCYVVHQRSGNHTLPKRTPKKHCANCAKEVTGRSLSRSRNGSQSKNIFCNRNCYDTHRTAIRESKVYGNCRACKAELSCTAGHTLDSVYCSNACRRLDKRAEPVHCLYCKCYFTPMKPVYRERLGRSVLVSNNSDKTCSKECFSMAISTNQARKDKISAAFTRENHPNWQGGVGAHGNRGFRGSEWPRLRAKVRERDGNKCVQCGMTNDEHLKIANQSLHVNHIKPFRQFGGDNQNANRMSNLETLCRSCHTKTEWQYRRENPMQFILAI